MLHSYRSLPVRDATSPACGFNVVRALLCVAILSAPSSGLAQDEKPAFETLFEQARGAHTNENYTDALAQYQNILLHYPKSQRVALRVAICQGKLGRINEAIAAYDRAIDMNPLEAMNGPQRIGSSLLQGITALP